MRDRHPDDLLSAFLDEELDEARSLDVARHVAACGSCTRELGELRRARQALRTLPDLTPPTSMFRDVAVAAAAHEGRVVRRRWTAATVGAVLGVGVAAFVLGGEQPGEVVPPVEMVVVDHLVRTGGGPVLQPVVLDR